MNLDRGQLLHGDRRRVDAHREDRGTLVDSRLKASVLVVGLGESGAPLGFDPLFLPRLRLAIVHLAGPRGVGLKLSRDLPLRPCCTLVLTLSLFPITGDLVHNVERRAIAPPQSPWSDSSKGRVCPATADRLDFRAT